VSQCARPTTVDGANHKSRDPVAADGKRTVDELSAYAHDAIDQLDNSLLLVDQIGAELTGQHSESRADAARTQVVLGYRVGCRYLLATG
jgi:hypothetical protein